MLTALYSVGSVAGADLWMKVVLLTSLAYFLICFSFRRSRSGRGVLTVLMGWLLTELLCDMVWLAWFWPGGAQWRPGIGGGTAALACAALPGRRHRAVDLPDWAVTSSQLPFGLILEDKEPPSVEMMEGGIFTDDNCLISWNFTLFLSDV